MLSEMKVPFDVTRYFAAFELLMRDFQKLLEYIEPTEENAGTYSHRTYELLLRACTECESVWRDMVFASAWNTTERDKMNGSDYRKLDADWSFSRFVVSLRFWRPEPLRVVPLREWAATDEKIPWYFNYNAVKHDRALNFPLASFRSVSLAFAGLFLTLSRLDFYGDLVGQVLHGSHVHSEHEYFWTACDGGSDAEGIQ